MSNNHADRSLKDLPSPKNELLAPNEVAAVRSSHEIYTADNPSPYLSRRQARESFSTTKRRHAAISTVFVVLLLGAMAAGIGIYAWETLKPAPTREVPTYDTAPIERKEFLDAVNVTSIVQPVNEAPVTSQVSGTIAEVFVEEGGFTEEGEVLYTIDNPAITETFDNATRALEAAQEDVDKKAAALDEINEQLNNPQPQQNTNNSTSSNSNSSSSQTPGITTVLGETTAHFVQAIYSADDEYGSYDDGTSSSNSSSSSSSSSNSSSSSGSNTTTTKPRPTEAQRKAAENNLEAANQRLASVRETFDRAANQFDALSVRAPFAGTVHDIAGQIAVGTQITGAERLCTVTDYSEYMVWVEIPADQRDKVNGGEEVRMSFPSISDLFLTCSVNEVTVNPDSGSKLANVFIDQPDERLTPKIACNLVIVVQSIPDALVVPIEAVHTNSSTGAQEISVLLDPTRGITANIVVEVLGTSALEAAVNASNIQEGTSVIITPPSAAPTDAQGAPAEPAPQEPAPQEPAPQEPAAEAPTDPAIEAAPEGEAVETEPAGEQPEEAEQPIV